MCCSIKNRYIAGLHDFMELSYSLDFTRRAIESEIGDIQRFDVDVSDFDEYVESELGVKLDV